MPFCVLYIAGTRFSHLLRLVQIFWVIASLLVLQKMLALIPHPKNCSDYILKARTIRPYLEKNDLSSGIWAGQSWPLLFLMKSSLHQCLTFYCIIASLNSFSCLPQAELSLISTIISTLVETLLCAVSTDHQSSHLLPLFFRRATEPSREVKKNIIFPLFQLKCRDRTIRRRGSFVTYAPLGGALKD